MSRRMISLSSLASMLVTLTLLSACGHTNVGMNRGFDEYDDQIEYESAMSPDAFVDRLGEPDEWRNTGEGSKLQMIAIWKCLEGEYREITWRIGQSDRGQQTWRLVGDTRGEGDCGS